MANIALGGILSGLMAGYDQQNELNHQRDERAYQKQRRAVTDSQQDRQFAANMTGLDQRNQLGALELQNAPARFQREAQLGDAQIKGYGLRNAMEQFQLDRAPTLAQQHDSGFALDQEGKRASIAHTRASTGLAGLQAQAARIGLDEKQLEQQRMRAQDTLMRGIVQGRMTGDWSGLVNGWNGTVGKAFGGNPLEGITRNEDGTFTAHAGGGAAMQFGGIDQLMEMAGAVTSPDAYLKGVLSQHYGNRQGEPADIRSARELAKGMQRNPGETDAQLFNRAYDRVRAKGYMDPSDLHAKIYQGTMAALKDDFNLTTEQKSQAAMEQADKYVQAMMERGDRSGGAFGAIAQQGAPNPTFADPGSGVAPPPRFAQPQRTASPQAAAQAPAQGARGRIVRTGTVNGRRVAQYEDGSIVPLQ